ncbi:MAG: anthranilate synthase component I [Deltaproteobacteria bacterium]|nr:anthranilate synthase component I [Deltaproteobacteria bacterium]
MYFPSLEQFREKAKEGNLIPVYKEIMADMETPVTAFLKIDTGNYSFLLESVEGGEKWARYSFLGSNPSIIFKCKGSKITISRDSVTESFESGDPLSELKKLLEVYRPVNLPELPRFYGGAVGFLGYDMVRFFEDIGNRADDTLQTDDAVFAITDTILIFDNLKHRIKVVSNAHIDGDVDSAYMAATARIDAIIERLKAPFPAREQKEGGMASILPEIPKEAFLEMVNNAKDYIKAGDIIQVVLSQRFKAELKADPFNIYRALKLINPSPYMYYLKLDDLKIIGTSPEILVRVEGGNVEVRPIAGTRPRGKTDEEDKALEKELLADPKERAEHIMLVDLGRNDIGRVSEVGSIHVTELMTVERYSHVMHIVSNVRGRLKGGIDNFEVLRATFPAGTVSGAPKVRAMEIIEELETSRRGPYAGCLGYVSFSGNMDMCITIRTMFIKGDTIYMQAGAGIVADSDPPSEYQETVNKATALFKAVEMASRGLE